MQLKPNRRQRGMTLVELMIGITISMLVIAGTIAVYLTSVRGGGDTVRLARLNQETRALFEIMTSELRRTGYCVPNPVQPSGCITDPPQEDIIISDDEACVLYYYERDSVNPTRNVLGFRLKPDDDIVEMLPEGSFSGTSITDSCDATTGWFALTDPESVSVTELEFSLDETQCMDLSDGDVTVGLCPTPLAANSRFYEVRRLRIQVTAQDARDLDSTVNLSEVVTFRNSRLLIQP